MDRCGEYLQIAGAAARRHYGQRVTVGVENQPPTFPEMARWVARVRDRQHILRSKYGPLPEVAVKLLAEELVSIASRDNTQDRDLLERAAWAGVG